MKDHRNDEGKRALNLKRHRNDEKNRTKKSYFGQREEHPDQDNPAEKKKGHELEPGGFTWKT